MAHISNLRRLSVLIVQGKGITQAGLEHLARMPPLVELHLTKTSVRDISPLVPKLPWMEHLDLANSPITDDGLRALSDATRLSTLDRSGTKITNAGLLHLTRLPRLKSLDLSETQVDDAGLLYLAGLPSLHILTLVGTPTTDAGVAALRKLRPQLRVVGSRQ
jgi:Leucine-rich repeat (LRR) protein